jgi:hypothetical protein
MSEALVDTVGSGRYICNPVISGMNTGFDV